VSTSAVPLVQVIRRRAAVTLTYDFGHCRCELTREATAVVRALFLAAVAAPPPGRLAAFSACPFYGSVTVAVRLGDALLCELEAVWAHPAA
jgi:hypothetical protein